MTLMNQTFYLCKSSTEISWYMRVLLVLGNIAISSSVNTNLRVILTFLNGFKFFWLLSFFNYSISHNI